MATIRKRGVQQWQAIVRKTGFPRYSQTFKTKAEAMKWSEKIEHSMLNDTFKGILKADTTTFEEVIQKYLTDVTSLKKGEVQERSRIKMIMRTLSKLYPQPTRFSKEPF